MMHEVLPISWFVILEELPPHLLAGVCAINDGINNARRTINNVKRWMEVVL
jgi:hypothetical protein